MWLLFLGWVGTSALSVNGLDRLAAALYRGSCYAAAAVLLLLVLNTSERTLSTRSVVLGLTALWGSAVGLAFLGLLLPDFELRSPVEILLPGRVDSIPFVRALVHPRLAIHDPLIGTLRPTPLFPYTNNWGSAVAILTPIAVRTMLAARSRTVSVAMGLALVLSLVPIIVSINRGLWLSLTVGIGYVLVRLAARGRRWSAVASAGIVAVVLVALVGTPLGTLVQERLNAPNTSTRETLYSASLAAAQEAPVLGHGAPISSEGLEDSNDVSIGTHGQFWTVLVSQGYPGVALFVGYLLLMAWRTRAVSDLDLWLHAPLVVLLVQLPVYDPLPAGLCVTFLCVALCLRRLNLNQAHLPSSAAATTSKERYLNA